MSSCPYHYGLNAHRSDCGFCIASGQRSRAAQAAEARHRELMAATHEQSAELRAMRREAAGAAARQESLLAEQNHYASITAQATETIAAITAEEADRTQRFHYSQWIQTPHGEAYLDWRKRAVALSERIQQMTLDWTNAWIGRAQTAAGPLDPYIQQADAAIDEKQARAQQAASTRRAARDELAARDAVRRHRWGRTLSAAGGGMTVLGLVLVLMTPSVPQFAPRGFLQANVYDPVNTVGWVLFGLGFLVASSGLVLWAAQTGRRGVEAAYTAVRNVDLDTTSGRVQQVGQAGAAVAGHVTQLGSQLTSGRAYARQAPMIAAYNDVIAQRLGPGIVHVAPTSVVEGAGTNAWLPGVIGTAQEWTAGTRPITSSALGHVSQRLAERRAAAAAQALPDAAAGMLRVWDRPGYEMVVAKSWSGSDLSGYLFELASFAERARTHYPSPDEHPPLRFPPPVLLSQLGADERWLPDECRELLADAQELFEFGPLNAPLETGT